MSPATLTPPPSLTSLRWRAMRRLARHLYAAGNTEEPYRIKVLGVRKKGRRRDGPFVHSTGRGYVAAADGQYAGPLAEHARVSVAIVESTGALTPRTVRLVAYQSSRTKGKHARDGTRYGTLRSSTRSFFVHHTQRISMAASLGNVDGLLKRIRARRQQLCAATGSTTTSAA